VADPDVAIVGSGIVGTAVAHALVARGRRVEVFEKGPEYPYPHDRQFREEVLYLFDNPEWKLPPDLKNLTASGDYRHNPNLDRFMWVGGSATQWEAITLRMRPSDFRTRSRYGYGDDWPIGYEDLEPHYGRAETLLGVSGSDADNPFAPPRSRPFPLPAFELSYDDRLLADQLKAMGLVLHTTPQARTRAAYDDRPGCANFGTCTTCPIGARYSPNVHLARAIASGRCRLWTGTSVRRVATDAAGRARALVVRPNAETQDREHPARVIVLAGGTIENARLLLLSSGPSAPDGLGNAGGQVGRGLTFHHIWRGGIRYPAPLYPGRFGGWTGQCQQFVDPPQRGRVNGVKVEFTSQPPVFRFMAERRRLERRGGAEILEALRPLVSTRAIAFHAESRPSPQKRVSLSTARDRFGDPFAHVEYQSDPADHATYDFARELLGRFTQATRGEVAEFARDALDFDNGSHHMGGCRMGRGPGDSVTDRDGRVHGVPNLVCLGGSGFVGSSGAVNPTLTMVALALRAADFIEARLLG